MHKADAKIDVVAAASIIAKETRENEIRKLKGKIGDFKGGLFDLNKAIEIEPDKEEAYITRAFLKGELKDYYGAISDYNKSISINSKNGQSFFYRSILKEKINDRKGACADSRKALSLGYKNVDNKKWTKKNC